MKIFKADGIFEMLPLRFVLDSLPPRAHKESTNATTGASGTTTPARETVAGRPCRSISPYTTLLDLVGLLVQSLEVGVCSPNEACRAQCAFA